MPSALECLCQSRKCYLAQLERRVLMVSNIGLATVQDDQGSYLRVWRSNTAILVQVHVLACCQSACSSQYVREPNASCVCIRSVIKPMHVQRSRSWDHNEHCLQSNFLFGSRRSHMMLSDLEQA